MVSANAKVAGMVVIFGAIMASTPYFAKKNTVRIMNKFFLLSLLKPLP
jgi:hypothetical protein